MNITDATLNLIKEKFYFDIARKIMNGIIVETRTNDEIAENLKEIFHPAIAEALKNLELSNDFAIPVLKTICSGNHVFTMNHGDAYITGIYVESAAIFEFTISAYDESKLRNIRIYIKYDPEEDRILME